MAYEQQRPGFNSLGQREFALQPSPKGQTGALHVPVPRYEFNIWIPSLTFGGGNTGLTGSHFSTYQRIGNRCYVDTDITLTAKGSSTGAAEIYFIPFGAWGNRPPLHAAWFNMTSTLVNMTGIVDVGGLGSNAILLYGLTAAGASLVALTHAAFSDTTNFRLSGFYTIEPA